MIPMIEEPFVLRIAGRLVLLLFHVIVTRGLGAAIYGAFRWLKQRIHAYPFFTVLAHGIARPFMSFMVRLVLLVGVVCRRSEA